MKALHVYSGNLFGGIERMLLALTTLPRAEIENVFALCFDARIAQGLRARGARVELLAPVRIRDPISVLRGRRVLERLLRGERFDAVICHGIWTFAVFAGAVRRAGGKPILYQHDIPNPKNGFYRWSSLRPPRICIANSAYTAKLVAAWLPNCQVQVVYPLVELPQESSPDSVRELRGEFGAGEGQVVILQGSRLDHWKGHRILLGALANLKHRADWRCWIAGSPQRSEEEQYRAELASTIRESGLGERVRFIGHRDDMPRVLAACDVYCQPNQVPEPYGLVFVEALALGKPVVSGDEGGVTEVVTRDCGILCKPNSKAVANALEQLLANPALRARMAQASRARIAELNAPGLFLESFFQALGQPRTASVS
ncbi:MAG TPA: glycosyltransferase family 4 protein [Polyangiaceae bacterium]|jgi:glycosyltransferase involved in cell wall biosynthesis